MEVFYFRTYVFFLDIFCDDYFYDFHFKLLINWIIHWMIYNDDHRYLKKLIFNLFSYFLSKYFLYHYFYNFYLKIEDSHSPKAKELDDLKYTRCRKLTFDLWEFPLHFLFIYL